MWMQHGTSVDANHIRPMWNRRLAPRAYLGYGLLAMFVAGVLAFAVGRPFLVLPRIAISPGFALTNQDGRRLTSEDLRGQIVIYNFTYSHCVVPCPETSPVMQAIQAQIEQIDAYGLPVKLVTITLDSERDTPGRLRAYADALGANTAVWHFLTGDAARLKEIIGGGFGVYYAAHQGVAIQFDPTFILVDGAGVVRARYRTAGLDLAVVQRDVHLIAREAHDSQGALRLAYEAAHLFVCYPP
jgi:protein SCO1/2